MSRKPRPAQPHVTGLFPLTLVRCRDVELAKFEAFLKKEEARDISALVRGSQRLAYPIKGCVVNSFQFSVCAYVTPDFCPIIGFSSTS
jgi:hypothetical protein